MCVTRSNASDHVLCCILHLTLSLDRMCQVCAQILVCVCEQIRMETVACSRDSTIIQHVCVGGIWPFNTFFMNVFVGIHPGMQNRPGRERSLEMP